MTTTTPTAQAAKFAAEAARLGFTFSVKPGMVTIRAAFTPGDSAAYVRCDGDGPSLLALAPIVGAGSQWGTDGGSIGGHVGLTGGHYRLNQSGVSKRFTSALARLAS